MLRRRWFLVLLFLVLAAGVALPGPGRTLAPRVGELIVVVLFLMSLTLPAARLGNAAVNWRAHAVALCVSFVLLPALCTAAALLLPDGEIASRTGLLLLGVLPCTLVSATVWTRMAGGNDAIPMVFTALSNGFCFLLAPAILWITLSRWVPVEAGPMAARLLLRVLLPILAGQIARAVLGDFTERFVPPVSFVCKLLVLLIVLIAVSQSADTIRAEPGSAAFMGLLTAGLHGAALLLATGGTRLLGLAKADAVGTIFAASQKTLYVGVYLAAAFYGGMPGALVPLVAYHVVQLVMDTVLAERLATRCSRS